MARAKVKTFEGKPEAAQADATRDVFAGVFTPNPATTDTMTEAVLDAIAKSPNVVDELLAAAGDALPAKFAAVPPAPATAAQAQAFSDDAARVFDFVTGGGPSANAASLTDIDPRFAPVTTILFDDEDWVAFHREFTAWLSLGDRQHDQAFVRKAHEAGPATLRKAQKVYLQVKNAREKWEAENDVVLGAMREQASISLEEEKAGGTRKKTITEADVKARAASLYPDEWPRQESRRREYKAVEARAQHDVEVALIRCKNLETIMNRAH